MLQDLDILEDWTAIRKVRLETDKVAMWWRTCAVMWPVYLFLTPPSQAVASLGPHRVKVDGKSLSSISGCRPAATPVSLNASSPFFPSSSRSEAWQTSPCGALRGRSTVLRQPVVLQGTGHLHQQEGRVSDEVLYLTSMRPHHRCRHDPQQ